VNNEFAFRDDVQSACVSFPRGDDTWPANDVERLPRDELIETADRLI
jgi:hypothetical protein